MHICDRIYMKISIMHGCLVQIENSFTRVTVLHPQACQVMESSICKEQLLWILFLHTLAHLIQLSLPGLVAWSDAHPPVIQTVVSSTLQSGKTFISWRLVMKGHLFLWWEDSLKEKYNTKYYKIYFYLIFHVIK